jgi:uncharacterized protein Yka (UPF0111/DUF47 family)
VLKLGSGGVFFDLLDGQAKVAQEAAREFLELARDLTNHGPHVDRLKEIEHKGDDLTHELQNRVAATFIPPLDQEDLTELSNVLDDITDFIEATGARIAIYRLDKPRVELEPLARQLVQITDLVAQATDGLRHRFGASPTLRGVLTQIHTVENESDVLFRTALAHLFDETGADPLTVMKWKEVFDRIETAIDRCEDLAKVIDNIIVKYA